MSYILEALKKSEAERQPEPDTTPVSFSPGAPATPPRRDARWIALILVINAVILVWLFFPSDLTGERELGDDLPDPVVQADDSPPAQENYTYQPPASTHVPQYAERRAPAAPAATRAATTTDSTASPAGEEIVITPDTRRQNLARAERAASTAPPVEAPTPEPATEAEYPDESVISIDDLPARDRADFPQLRFSTHVFASDADLRAMVVNGRRLTEGARFEEMTLHRITETGAIFDYRGHLVAVSVLDTWAAD